MRGDTMQESEWTQFRREWPGAGRFDSSNGPEDLFSIYLQRQLVMRHCAAWLKAQSPIERVRNSVCLVCGDVVESINIPGNQMFFKGFDKLSANPPRSCVSFHRNRKKFSFGHVRVFIGQFKAWASEQIVNEGRDSSQHGQRYKSPACCKGQGQCVLRNDPPVCRPNIRTSCNKSHNSAALQSSADTRLRCLDNRA